VFVIGVTRATVMDIVRSLGLQLVERRISLAEFHCADEVFTTGTMGELTPVYEIDGRRIGEERVEKRVTRQIQAEYTKLTATMGCPIPGADV
jgi:branched-subunit amino acid aminotransferase/4-amino-4-deoxychorismate lyase